MVVRDRRRTRRNTTSCDKCHGRMERKSQGRDTRFYCPNCGNGFIVSAPRPDDGDDR